MRTRLSITRLTAVSVESPAPLRKDAQRNREAILNAARELFAQSADVHMCEVARRAGVGQATLYRNFPDRLDLAAALLEELMSRIEQLASDHANDPDAFFVLLRSVVESTAYPFALGELARDHACLSSRLEQSRERLATIMTQPLCQAKATGRLRRDLSIDDVFLLLWMVRGAMERGDGPAARATAASRSLALILDGLTPPPTA